MTPASRARARRLAWAAVALLSLELAVAFVAGRSLLGLHVSSPGFALRAALLGLSLSGLAAVSGRLGPARAGRLCLVLLLLPALVHLEARGGRLSGVDSISYYVFLRSMVKDRDFELSNEYEHYGMLARPDLSMPTSTGHRRSIYSIGPALSWTPFFLAGEGLARIEAGLGGRAVDLSGYGPHHVNAVALGSFLYGAGALLAIHALLLRHFRGGTALFATLAVASTTFFYWYLVVQPTYSHSVSTLLAALAILLWDRERRSQGGPADSFFLGLMLGLAICVRWQNGVLLILPGLSFAGRLLKAPRRWPRLVGGGAALLAGVGLGAFPQMAAWKALYDTWVLPYPPQGRDFLRLDHPWVLETLFGSRHGLLSWTPALWAGYLGFVPLARRRPSLFAPLLVPLALMSYVNFCVGDYWGGGSFSNRRFDSLLPVFAFGLAAAIDALRSGLRARPALALAACAAPLVLWNATLAEQVRRGLVPRDDTVAFARLAGNAARLLSDAVGFPTTWPASWVFAWRHRLPPGRFDLLVGRYLFYRQNSVGNRVDLAAPDHEPLLGEGWGPVESRDGRSARRARAAARLLAPLDVPETLAVRVRAEASGGETPVRLLVNGLEAGRFLATPGWDEHRVLAASSFWRRELNDVVLDAGGRELWVSEVVFERMRAPGR